MAKVTQIKLGYYERSHATYRQIQYIEELMQKRGYIEEYKNYILKYGLRNPMKRITKYNASILIRALLNNDRIYFYEKYPKK